MRILIIDDEAPVVRAFARMLRTHVVTACTDARDALAMIREGLACDAILCDLRMPNMTGRDFDEALRALSPELATRILFTSGGLCNAEDIAFAKTRSMLMKPFSGRDLSLALRPLFPVIPPLCAA